MGVSHLVYARLNRLLRARQRRDADAADEKLRIRPPGMPLG